MASLLQASLGLLRSRLSRRIVFWVFLSILVIEVIIFIPSFYRRKQERLRELEIVSSEVLFSIKASIKSNMAQANMLQSVQAELKPDSVIVGGALYGPDCRLVDSFGELPEMSCVVANHQEVSRGLSRDGQRYDVAWPKDFFDNQYILIVRHDTRQLQRQMTQYALTIGGLVIIISAFVTLSTVLVLERLLINPLLRLRDDLLAAGDAVSREESPNFYSLSLQRNDELGEVAHAFSQMFQRVQYEIQERRQAEAALKAEQEKSERLLQNILPSSIADQLKRETGAIASRFDSVTILFADIVDFTGLSVQISPTQLVCLLNDIFSRFDHIAERLNLEKIKTIGDAYMVVGGLPHPRPDHAEAIMEMAVEMLSAIRSFKRKDDQPFHLRIGINTGPVVAGVIGLKKFSYDLWGDAVNLASRMESHGLPDTIQVSTATYAQLRDRYPFVQRDPVAIKGRGMMVTYLYQPPDTP